MTVDASLFGDDDPLEADSAQAPTSEPETIPDWQIEQIRNALDARGVVAMDERQRLVVKYAGREVASLRDLTWTEARAVAEGLAAESKARGESKGSAWDQREGDTWIDLL